MVLMLYEPVGPSEVCDNGATDRLPDGIADGPLLGWDDRLLERAHDGIEFGRPLG